jgi:two-component system chemotaxis sensor kinase CheA
LPIAYLNQVLGLKSAELAEAVNIVVLQAEDRQFGLVVDGINDTQEIVVKPLGKQLKDLTLYAGATIMGDGRVALILDVLGIGQGSGVFVELHEQARASGHQKAQSEKELQRMLLFQTGSFERLAVPLSLVARLELFPQSAIEHAGGGQVIQYRGRILPLVSLRAVLESGALDGGLQADPVQVVVFTDGDRSVGMVVDQILDIVEEVVTVRQKVGRKGLLGSAVIGNRVTDFLDLNEIVQAAAESWFQGAGGHAAGKRVLVAEASAFSRCMIRSGLDMAGYSVTEAANVEEAVREMEKQSVDVVLAALDLPLDGSSALLAAMHRRPEWEKIPVLALSNSAKLVQSAAARQAGFQDCQAKFDSVPVLESVAKLVSPLTSADVEAVCVGEVR